MTQTARAFFESLRGKQVAVAGIGVSHRPLLRRLAAAGARITAYDKNPDTPRAEWDALGISLCLGEDYLAGLTGDLIFRSPSLRPDHPALLRAKAEGAAVTSEAAECLRLCPCPLFGVTGSDGKTTTASLMAAMLAAGGKNVWLGGNIGNPLLSRIEDMSADDICVMELSSFQLADISQSPAVAVVTNISPNHLDWHTDMDEYIGAKRNILAFQHHDDLAVLNDDNEAGAFLRGKGRTVRFGGYMVADGLIDGLIPLDELRLRGWHNVENIMAARCAVRGYVSEDAIRQAAAAFTGVEHRDQWVGTVSGADYYNDSIGSSPSRCAATLRAHTGKVILIAGGRSKNTPFAPLAALFPAHVSALLLIGEAAAELEAAAKAAADAPAVIHCETMANAVQTAHKLAKPGDTVLLSPACASFDQFKDFAERGEEFMRLVKELPKKELPTRGVV